jgi:CDP-glucose 4,6-dehydratase
MDTFRGKSVFVTGATGMVGSWLVKELLKQQAKVTILVLDSDPQSELIRSNDIKKCKVFNGDLKNRNDISRAIVDSCPDVVFHLGAQTIVGNALLDPVGTFESNIQGTWNLLDVLRATGMFSCAIVVASSDKAYGTSKNLPYDESTPLLGEGPYDVSKSCTDLLARSYHLTYGLKITIARCGNIYGGGDLNWSRIVPGAISDLLSGKKTKIRSNGLFLRDYLYVKDVVDAYLNMASKLIQGDVGGEAYNISREEPITVLEIYRTISNLIVGKYAEPVIMNEAKNEIKDQHLSSQKAKQELSWVSNFPLELGLKETIDWYKEYFRNTNI